MTRADTGDPSALEQWLSTRVLAGICSGGFLLLAGAAGTVWSRQQVVLARLDVVETTGSRGLYAHIESERMAAMTRAQQDGRIEEQLLRLREDVAWLRRKAEGRER